MRYRLESSVVVVGKTAVEVVAAIAKHPSHLRQIPHDLPGFVDWTLRFLKHEGRQQEVQAAGPQPDPSIEEGEALAKWLLDLLDTCEMVEELSPLGRPDDLHGTVASIDQDLRRIGGFAMIHPDGSVELHGRMEAHWFYPDDHPKHAEPWTMEDLRLAAQAFVVRDVPSPRG